MRIEKEYLEFLAQRLEQIAKGDFCNAALLVRKVMESTSPELDKLDAEQALYLALWGYASRALEHLNYDPANKQTVCSLESEMAGRVLVHRIRRGWLCSSETAPSEFPDIECFL